ncbi:hypothetical protein DBR42_24450 [Pelomonas sp. HMWF004]|nr:hypothetical protein DBR42_24450 [Pelomonas sp. HMWF004]
MTAVPRPPLALRREALRVALPQAANLLARRQASDISELDIDDYVTLNWLEWNGGGLRLTTTGDNICKQLMERAK